MWVGCVNLFVPETAQEGIGLLAKLGTQILDAEFISKAWPVSIDG